LQSSQRKTVVRFFFSVPLSAVNFELRQQHDLNIIGPS
jgi:hypothetical protein